MRNFVLVMFLLCGPCLVSMAQEPHVYAELMARTVLKDFHPADAGIAGRPAKWSYDHALTMKAIEGVWHKTSDKKYFDYIQKSIDGFVDNEGNIMGYREADHNIDNIPGGRVLLTLYAVTRKSKYYQAALRLREQLKTQPRTKEGGFWHKRIYPWQMWLDGLYMGEPFYAEWAATFHEDTAFSDIAKQFILMEKYSVDGKTGLMYHGYDESREQQWADKTTGHSPNFWGRAMGWYGMGLVDALEYFPENQPERKILIGILNRFAVAVAKFQDGETGLWWDVLNFPRREKNYFEASASSMFVYTLLKGVRLGYLPADCLPVARKGYAGILSHFIEKRDDGLINLTGTVSVSGLGGKPYRDGSYEYYMSEKVVTNDLKGVGSFILASNEMELLPALSRGAGKTVLLDSYFNDEYRKDAAGIRQSFHYKWTDQSNDGYSLLGYLFNAYGVKTSTLRDAPRNGNLKNADIYIIVDPDDEKEVTSPHFIGKKDIRAIRNWVRRGGVLLMFANDSGHTELPHFNNLAKEFGIRWSDKARNFVRGKDFKTGEIMVPPGNPVFTSGLRLYLKEICVVDVSPPAEKLLAENGDVIMAAAKYGKGTVFAVGDPWLYNEYTDGRKLPAGFQNNIAARDLIKWVIERTKH